MKKYLLIIVTLIFTNVTNLVFASPNLEDAFITSPDSGNSALMIRFYNNLGGTGTVDLTSVDLTFYAGVATGGSQCSGKELGGTSLSGHIYMATSALPVAYGFEKSALYETASDTVPNPLLATCLLVREFHGMLGSSAVHTRPAKAFTIVCSPLKKKCSYVQEFPIRDVFIEEV